MTTEIIQMKISLDWIKPLIWRRFIVDSSISLEQLHCIIQIIMGWSNSHLYGFFINGKEYSNEYATTAKSNARKKINKLRLKENECFYYIYDFGDNWEHTILVEKTTSIEEELLVPRCLEGARNCPPEDCGSVPGYESIVKAMKKPGSESAKEIIDWLGEKYDPEYFNPETVNLHLNMFRRHKPRTTRKRDPADSNLTLG